MKYGKLAQILELANMEQNNKEAYTAEMEKRRSRLIFELHNQFRIVEPMFFGRWEKTKALGVFEDFTGKKGKREFNRANKFDDGLTKILFASCTENNTSQNECLIITLRGGLLDIIRDTSQEGFNFKHRWNPRLLPWLTLYEDTRDYNIKTFGAELAEFFNQF